MEKKTIQGIGAFTSLGIAVIIAILFYDPTGTNYLVPVTSFIFLGLMIFFMFGYNHNLRKVKEW